MKRRSLLFLALIAMASPLLAVDIVFNSSFNGSLSGWALGPGTTYDGTVDATGVAGSGSARSATTISGNTIVISQCIAVVPGPYTLSGKIFIPAGQGTNAFGAIGVTWFGGGNCGSGPILGFITPTTSATGSFVSVSQQTTAPPGTTFAFVNAQHIAPAGRVAYFDDIVLDNGTAVPALGPFALAALMPMLAAAGMLMLRR